MKLTISGIPVEVTRKRIKNIYLRVKPDGRALLSAPTHMTRGEIDAFLRARTSWLQKNVAAAKSHPPLAPASAATGETLYLWGRPHVLIVREIPGCRPHAAKDGARILLTVRPGTDAAHRAALLKEILRGELSKAIARRLPVIEHLTGLHAEEWRTKDMKTRWGTCNIRERRIWINLQLVHHPEICLDYILLHELLHLVEKYHNERFYGLMTKFMPEWRKVRALLNQ